MSASPSGGNTYDAELLAGLRRLGLDVAAAPIATDPQDRVATERALALTLPVERCWLIDAIVAGAAPDLIAQTTAGGTAVVVLVHHFGADQPGLGAAERTRIELREQSVLSAATAVVCPSRWAARQLAIRYGVETAVVAPPGVDRAALGSGSRPVGSGTPAHLLAVGSLTPVKDQLTLVAALARLGERSWRASVVGSDTADPAYAAVLRRAVADAGLAGRVVLTGPLVGADLDQVWRTADLLVHPSRSETYGLVVTEALARGIPALVSAGTGLVEALQAGRSDGEPLAGAVVPAGRPADLATALTRWLDSDELAAGWAAAARRQRERLPGWDTTAAIVSDLLAGHARLR